QTFGLDGPIFANFFRTPDDQREFLQGMHGFGLISSPHVVAAFDLSAHRHLVDLGGATGHLAVAACRRYPGLRATAFDLPGVMPQAREAIAAEADVTGRVDLMAGDFFVDALPPADLYAVGRILHDWGEEKIDRLLSAIHAALPAGGALLIVEKLIAPERDGPRWAQLETLNMPGCGRGKGAAPAENGGRVRGGGVRGGGGGGGGPGAGGGFWAARGAGGAPGGGRPAGGSPPGGAAPGGPPQAGRPSPPHAASLLLDDGAVRLQLHLADLAGL